MSKKYTFEFRGSMDDFLQVLDGIPAHRSDSGGKKRYSFEKYIVDIIDGELRFGVRRIGYTGGRWYCPTVTVHPDRVEFCGKIRSIEEEVDRPRTAFAVLKDLLAWVQVILLTVVFLPVLLLLELYTLAAWAVRKIFRLPTRSEEEENLDDLMQRCLHCSKPEIPAKKQ